MSRQDKNAFVVLAGSIFVFIGVCSKPLQIPDPWNFLPMLAGAICFLFVIRTNKKIKAEQVGKAVLPVPIAAKKKHFWLVAITLIAGSIGVIPLLPYTVENYGPWLLFYVVPAQIIFLSVFLFYLWKKLVGSANLPK